MNPRQQHPDSRTELRLQQILGHQAAITRQETLIAEYHEQLAAARKQQDRASRRFRWSSAYSKEKYFKLDVDTQAKRIEQAQTGITAAEESIAAQREAIARLAAELSESDLAYL
jgi:hypothetical protein